MSKDDIVIIGFAIFCFIAVVFPLIRFIVDLRYKWLRGSYYKRSRHDIKIDKHS